MGKNDSTATPARRTIKPATLLAHVLDHIAENSINNDSPIEALIHSIERDIVADAVGRIST